MKSFSFREILLVSYAERRARRIKFHPRATVLQGPNETGKSSIIKSLFRTFGAVPSGESPRWKTANVRSVVRFDVEGEQFSFLRHGDRYAAFDAKDRLLGAFDSVTNGVAPFLSELLGFRLRLPNRQSEFVDLPPGYLFLPLYMDQDGSWQQPWSAFKALNQFANWKKGVIEYHAGIRGRAYYEAQAAHLRAQTDLQKAERKKDGLADVYDGLAKEFQAAQFNVDYDGYKSEVEGLLRECEKLRTSEEKFKVEFSQLRNREDSLKAQLAITEHARKESEKDYDFAKESHDEVGCPTCGAVYENSFKERFLIAVDEETCTDLAIKIRQELATVVKDLEKVRKAAETAAADLDEIEKLLAKKEGELELRDLIRQDGRQELKRVMGSALSALESEASSLILRAHEAGERMKKLDSARRRKHVNAFYAERMAQFVQELEVLTLTEESLRHVSAPPESTGSEGVRVLIAYKVAFLHVMKEFGDCKSFPFVIDSPKQQDQDEGHSKKILAFLKKRLPAGTQMILGLVDPEGIAFGGDEVALDRRLQLLKDEEFEVARAEVQSLTESMLSKG